MKIKWITTLIAAKGGKLVYLPSYSPDLNPIEHWWFPMKNEVRKSLDKGIALEQAAIMSQRDKAVDVDGNHGRVER